MKGEKIFLKKIFLLIIESVVSSPFVKAEADSDRIFCTVFETVCASSLAMCAHRICERNLGTIIQNISES
jgi:hypothetical protein